MKEIELIRGKSAFVDDEDYERLSQHKWHEQWDGLHWYARRGVKIKGEKETIRMHREIMNAPKNVQVDHINGNGLDNRKENLRLATHTQNMWNRIYPNKNNKFKIKGVCWHERDKKFRAQIGVNGKVIHLGYFNVMGDADSAYRFAEEKYFGEFARTIVKKYYPTKSST